MSLISKQTAPTRWNSCGLGMFLLLSLTACNDKDAPAVPLIPSTMLAAVQTPKPDYPMELLCAGVGGTTVLKVVVGREGKPVEVSLIGSSGQATLDEAAQKVVPTWVFEAATRNGQPVVQTIQVPVKFSPPAERPSECFQLDERK